MATFQGKGAAMLLLVSALMAASVSLAAAEPALGGRRLLTIPLGGEGEPVVEDVDVEDGPERRVLAYTSPDYGGTGGSGFNDNLHLYVHSLIIRCGNAVDQIRTTYSDNTGLTFTHGQNGGSDVYFPFSWSQPVTITVYTAPKPDEGIANMVRGIKISQGSAFQTCGDNTAITGSQLFTLYNIIVRGFKGRAGRHIDALGIYYN